MIFIKDYSDDSAIISDTFTDIIGNATPVSSYENVAIYEFIYVFISGLLEMGRY